MLGQMAAPIGKGSAEIGVGAGVGYSSQVAPPTTSTLPNGVDTQQNQQVSHGFALPGIEGNAHFGLTDKVGFNAHFSSAGVQPGVKITLNHPRDRAHFALMPQFAVGYASYGQSVFVTGADGIQHETMPMVVTSFTFMLGLRAIVSHKSGFYASAGYDLILTRSATSSTEGMGNSVTPTSSLTTSVQHQIAVNVGFTVEVGWLRIRPEIAVGILPAISTSFYMNGNTASGYGGYGFVILPGFTLAAATPRAARDEGAEEDEKQMNPEKENPGNEGEGQE